MSARLVALDEGPDIPLDGTMLVVGRHPQCDTRLDSIRVSRRHCCMSPKANGEVDVRDLGSTNGIRINGQRVESGRLKPGDELSIAHIRYRLEDGLGQELTLAESIHPATPPMPLRVASPGAVSSDNPLAAAVRDLLPSAMADRCRIQVIVQMQPDTDAEEQEDSARCQPDSSP